MLVNTNEVAKRLKITNRAVQNKCKQYGLVKIANQYQITQEIAHKWYVDAEMNKGTNQNRTEHFNRTSHRTDKNTSFLYWFIIGLILVISIVVFIVFYFTFETQIKETNKDLRQERIEHKTDVKELQKIVDSQKDTINKKELEIQSLKIKDSLRLFRRW